MAIYINGKKVAGRGISGKSPYQIAVEGGYTGTEKDFNDQLVAIGDAVKGFNELSQQVENAKTEIENAVTEANTAVDNAKKEIAAAKTDINNTVSSAKTEINNTKKSATTELDKKVTEASTAIDKKVEQALAQIPDSENIATKAYVDEKVNSLVTDIYKYGSTAPTNKKLLWIDSNSSTGGLKYYNGSSWVHVPVAWS